MSEDFEQTDSLERENTKLKEEINVLNQTVKELTERLYRTSSGRAPDIVNSGVDEASLYSENLQLKELNKELTWEVIELRRRVQTGSEIQYQPLTPESENEVIDRIMALCVKLAHLNPEQVPSVDDLKSDPKCLDFFIHQLTTSFEMQQANIRKLERELKAAQQSSGNHLSPAVAHVVEKVQRTCSELQQTLHDDHLQLIDIMTASENPFEEDGDNAI